MAPSPQRNQADQIHGPSGYGHVVVVGSGRCRGSPSRAWNGILHFVYFSQFSSRLIGCPHNHVHDVHSPRTDTYAAMASGQWPPMFSISSGHISSPAQAVFYLPLAVAFVDARRNFDFMFAFRAADHVLILQIPACTYLLLIALGINARLVEKVR